IIEALIGRSELPKAPHQQRTRPTRPQEQRQMRQIAALDDGFGQLIHDGLLPAIARAYTASGRSCARHLPPGHPRESGDLRSIRAPDPAAPSPIPPLKGEGVSPEGLAG